MGPSNPRGPTRHRICRGLIYSKEQEREIKAEKRMPSSTFKEIKFSFSFLLPVIHYHRPFPFIPLECLQIKRKSLRNVRNVIRMERQSFIPLWIDETSGSRRGCFKINGVFADVTEGISPPSHRQRFIILKKTLEGRGGGAGFILPSELMARKGAQAQRKRTCSNSLIASILPAYFQKQKAKRPDS